MFAVRLNTLHQSKLIPSTNRFNKPHKITIKRRFLSEFRSKSTIWQWSVVCINGINHGYDAKNGLWMSWHCVWYDSFDAYCYVRTNEVITFRHHPFIITYCESFSRFVHTREESITIILIIPSLSFSIIVRIPIVHYFFSAFFTNFLQHICK